MHTVTVCPSPATAGRRYVSLPPGGRVSPEQGFHCNECTVTDIDHAGVDGLMPCSHGLSNVSTFLLSRLNMSGCSQGLSPYGRCFGHSSSSEFASYNTPAFIT